QSTVRRVRGCSPGRLGNLWQSAIPQPTAGSEYSVCDDIARSRIGRPERLRYSTMTCQELAGRIQELQSDASPRDVARLCLLLANFVGNIDELTNEPLLCQAWREMGIRLQAATDQHAAMTEELEEIANCDPRDFTAE